MFSAKRVLQIGRGVGIRFFSEAKDPGKKSVRELAWERKEGLCDFYNQNHPKHKDNIFRVFSYAQKQEKMDKKIKPLSQDATLAEAIEAVRGEKLTKI